MQAHALEGGFTDAPIDAARAFRGLMTAMARPGTICDVSGATPPAPLGAAAGTAILTLCDPDTPIYLGTACDTQDVRDWITFQTGAPFVPPAQAMFAVGGGRSSRSANLPSAPPNIPTARRRWLSRCQTSRLWVRP